jgi:hypothetical protein
VGNDMEVVDLGGDVDMDDNVDADVDDNGFVPVDVIFVSLVSSLDFDNVLLDPVSIGIVILLSGWDFPLDDGLLDEDIIDMEKEFTACTFIQRGIQQRE